MKQVDYEHGRFIIVTTMFDPKDYFYSDYEEECEMNDREPQGEASDDYWDWMAETAQLNFDEDMDAIKRYEQYNVPVVIEGSLGLWDGRHEIEPMETGSVYSAITDIIGRDVNDIEVFFDDGHIEVLAHHHDGTNVFTISAADGKALPYLYR